MKRRLIAGLMAGFFLAPMAAAAGDGVLVFGGSGRTGIEIVRELREQGMDVTVFVRPTSDRSPLDPLGVDYVVGDALKYEDVEKAFSSGEFDAAVSAIGRRRGDVRPDYVATANIIKAAVNADMARLILISSVGAGNSRQYLSEFPEFMIEVFETKTLAENELIASGLEYTIIRPGGLLKGEATGNGQLTDDVSNVGGSINRADLGALTVDVLGDDSTIGKILHAYDPDLEFGHP